MRCIKRERGTGRPPVTAIVQVCVERVGPPTYPTRASNRGTGPYTHALTFE